MIRGYAKIWANRIRIGEYTIDDINEADREDVRAMYLELFGESMPEPGEPEEEPEETPTDINEVDDND